MPARSARSASAKGFATAFKVATTSADATAVIAKFRLRYSQRRQGIGTKTQITATAYQLYGEHRFVFLIPLFEALKGFIASHAPGVRAQSIRRRFRRAPDLRGIYKKVLTDKCLTRVWMLGTVNPGGELWHVYSNVRAQALRVKYSERGASHTGESLSAPV